MRETVEKAIDGELYLFQQFNTTTSLKVLAKLTRLLGEPLILALGALGIKPPPPAPKLDANGLPPPAATVVETPKLIDREFDGSAMAKAVTALVERLDEDEVALLVKKLASEGVTCGGQPIVFDEHYAGNFGRLFKVLGVALEVQYGNFLGAVSAKAKAAAAAVAG
jgi:hypothetical protein